MSQTDELFKAIPQTLSGADALRPLAEACIKQGAWRELFEVRLMQARLAAGLPVDAEAASDAPAELGGELEASYRAACREAGQGLLQQRRWRDAWRYLNAADEAKAMRAALSRADPSDADAEELIEVALHEGVHPEQGLRWLLQRYGTCNGVSALDGVGPHLSSDDLQACVEALVDWISEELSAALRASIEHRDGVAPEGGVPELITDRDWLFQSQASHVDASHLAAATRWSRALESPGAIQRAAALAEYGQRLHADLRYADAPPFEATYPAHLLFLNAQLGQDQDAALDYFRRRAELDPADLNAPACVETYLLLLTRLKRYSEALHHWKRLTGVSTPYSALLPKPLNLARESGDWQAYAELMRELGDPVGHAAGLLAQGS